jgi:glutamate--cysteine ligase
MRSTCRCISSSAATNTSTSPGKSFRDHLGGKLIPGDRATLSDWANHVSTIFPEVRLKRYIEMRGSDGGPWRRLPSLPAFWVGPHLRRRKPRRLLGDREGLDREGAPATARRRAKLGFKATIRGQSLLQIAKQTLALAEQGLARRKKLDQNGRDETGYLRPLQEIVARGITPAEELLEKYHGPWNGSVDPIFDEYAY